METNLAYIDSAVETAIEARASRPPKIATKDKDAIRDKASRRVAGFKVYDEEAEKRMLDEMIAKQRKSLEMFIADRTKVRDKLGAIGIKPLAVLPTVAWDKICDATELFRFTPDAQGRVPIPREAFDAWKKTDRKFWIDPLVTAQKHDWKGVLKAIFPNYRAVNNSDPGRLWVGQSYMATVMLPPAPDDVTATLLKVDAAKITMHVAAVADAIGFKESLVDLRDSVAKHYEDEDRRIQALRNEPFIYTNEGCATAIIAQFGDFPIEKEVVDMVVAGDDLIPEHVNPVSSSSYSGGSSTADFARQYAQQMQSLQALQGGQQLNSLQNLQIYNNLLG